MKVAVLGSWNPDKKNIWKLKNHETFRLACANVGKALAKAGHQLIFARTERDTADKYAREGLISIKGSKNNAVVMEYDRTGTPWAKAHLGAVKEAAAIIVLGGADGTYAAGQAAMFSRKRLLPISNFGGAAAALSKDYRPSIPQALVSQLNDKNWFRNLPEVLLNALNEFPRLLIIHGRAKDKSQLKTLWNESNGDLANLPKPIIMGESRHGGAPTIPEAFERLVPEADGAIAIITPEDIGAEALSINGKLLSRLDLVISQRARQNVWLEVGWIIGRLGRGRILLLSRGNIEMPSDFGNAILCHKYKDNPCERLKEIKDFIHTLKNPTPSSEFGDGFRNSD